MTLSQHPDEERDVAELKRIAFLIDQLGFRAHDAEAIGEDADAVVGAEDAQAILLRSVAAELPALRQQLTTAQLNVENFRNAAENVAQNFDTATDRITALEAQLTEAQADRERLDWLERTGGYVTRYNKPLEGWQSHWESNDIGANGDFYGATARDAIDAARLASSSESGT